MTKKKSEPKTSNTTTSTENSRDMKSKTVKKPVIDSEKEFEKKHKVGQLIVPLIGALVTAVMSFFGGISAAYVSRVEYKMSSTDQVEVNHLAFEIEGLIHKYLTNDDQAERDKLHAQLTHVTEAEANIMKKYNPDYRPRWSKPLHIRQLPIEPRHVREPWSPFGRVFYTTLAVGILLSTLSFFIIKWLLKLKPKLD